MQKTINNLTEELICFIRAMASKEAEGILVEACHKLEEGISFKDIELQVRKRTLELGGGILEQAIMAAGKGYQTSRIDCKCGEKKEFVGYRSKTLVSLLKPINIQRAYYHCDDCGESAVPLDRKLDTIGTSFTPAVREAVSFVGAEISFERSAILLKGLLDLDISKQKCELISEGCGKEIIQQLAEEEDKITASLDKDAKNIKECKTGEHLYISADGTMVNTDEGWKETKIGAVFWAERSKEGEPIRGRTEYLGDFCGSEKFGWRLFAKATGAGLEKAAEVIVIGDGARWIWNEADMHFPKAVQIVDWFHAVEKLWDLSKDIYGEGTDVGKKWVKKLEGNLSEGEIEKIINSLKRLKCYKKRHSDKIERTSEYFLNNKKRMRYRDFREKGYFIGSGVIESGCKHIVGSRLKRSGMKWSLKGADAVLQLRLCLLNGTWASFYAWHLNKNQNPIEYLPTN